MSRIRDVAVTIYSADTGTAVCNMPVHVTGDLLLAFAAKDGTAAQDTPANWYSALGSASTGARGDVFSRRAQSSSETVSIAITAAGVDARVIVIVSIEGTYGSATNGSDAFDVTTTASAEDATAPYAAGTITTVTDNCLIFNAIFTDATYSVHHLAGWPVIFTGDSGTNSLAIAYTQQKTLGTITGPTAYPGTGAQDDTKTWMVAIKDGSSNTLCDAYLDRGTTPAYLLSRLNGSATGDRNTPAYIAAASATLTSVLVGGSTSKTCTAVSWGTATTDSAYDPYGTSSLQTGASSTTNFSLSECTFSTWDLTQGKGLLFGMYAFALPRDYVDLGAVSTGGIALNLTSGSTSNARAWCIGGQFDKTTKQIDYNPFVIQVQQSNNTAYAWSASAVTWSGVSRVGFLTQGYYGVASARWQGFHVLNVAVFAGGSTTYPFDLDDIAFVVNKGCGNIPIINKAGSAITCSMPLQFGGGDPCAVLVDLATIQFPTSTVTDTKYRNFHVDPDYIGIEFYGKASTDSFKFTNTVFTSGTSYYWRFHASHSANAILDFSGSSVINANVLLRSTVNLTSLNFIQCTQITAAGGTLTDIAFKSTRGSNGAVSITGSTQALLQADLDKLVGCSWTSNAVGLRIIYTGSGNVTLNMSSGVFTSNTKDIRWEAGASQTLTVNKSGTCNVTSWESNNSTTVTIVASVVLTLTGLLSGSDIVIKTSDTNTALVNVDANSGTTYEYNYTYSAGTYVDITIMLAGQKPLTIYDYLLSSSDSSLPISQVVDRDYV